MTQRQFSAMLAFVRRSPWRQRVVTALCVFLPWGTVAVYGGLLGFLLLTGDPRLGRVTVVPLISLLLVTLLRIWIDRPRPYERYVFDPLLAHRQGQSFPSRHTASAVSIGLACVYVQPVFGAVMLFMALLIAGSRVVAGVHDFWDVAAGAGISLCIGLPGFWWIP